MTQSSIQPKHSFLSIAIPVLFSTFIFLILEGCISSKTDSPHTTLLRVGGLIDGSAPPVKTPTWVKIVNGVITQIAADIPENKHFEAEASAPSTLYIDARNKHIIPGFIGLFSNSAGLPLSEQSLNNLLAKGITTLVLVGSNLDSIEAIQGYAIDAQRRTPRIALGALLRPQSAREFQNALRELSNTPIEMIWLSPPDDVAALELCKMAAEASFHELRLAIQASRPISCHGEVPTTIRQCSITDGPNQKCLFINSRKIGILTEVSNNKAVVAVGDYLQDQKSGKLRELSWGAAHLMGYQDALGKLQVGYRGDFLLVAPPNNEAHVDEMKITDVFIDGLPQDLNTTSYKSRFWFWKNVTLGL